MTNPPIGVEEEPAKARAAPARGGARSLALVLAMLAAAGLLYWFAGHAQRKPETTGSLAPAVPTDFKLGREQRASLTVEPVTTAVFHEQVTTDGKIAVDEDLMTPVFSPYAGRIVKLLVKPGDLVTQGQPLFVVEATDMVQGLNDYVSALTGLNKAKSQLRLMEAAFSRSADLYKEKAVSLKDYQQAEANVVGAKNDLQAAETGLEAARNRLRILGKTEPEIATLDKTGKISAETVIQSPLAGSVVQRKAGPGQYVNAGAADPVFVIGDLNKLWLIANVRETDAPRVRVGQQLKFTILADTQRTFTGTLSYIAPTVDPTTRRLQVRAEIDNPDGFLRPEMFANVEISTSDNVQSPAVPRPAVIYEGSVAHIWVVSAGDRLEQRAIKTGLASGNLVQVTEGLQAGEQVVTKGALFVDKLTGAGEP